MNHVARHPMEILPLEVWAAVFDNLTTASDLLSCAKVSPAWVAFLKNKNPWISLAEIFKFLLPYLDTHTQLVCRRICHRLTEVVDDLLSRQAPMVLRTKLKNEDSFHTRVFEDRNNQTKFGIWNPSLWHSIIIQRVQQAGLDWRLRVLSCLVRRGEHVEKCELTLLSDEEHAPMRQLLEILTYLPNLKELIVVCEGWRYGPKRLSWPSGRDERIRLPRLKYLEKLQLISMSPSVANRILDRYGSQLKKCSIY